MSKRNDGGPAFPSLHYSAVEHGEESKEYASFEGMALRDWFAGQALAGAVFSGENCDKPQIWMPDDIARSAYLIADSMLAARQQEVGHDKA